MEATNLAQVKSFHWRSLLDLAALANLAVLLFMGLAQSDTLALVLGTITIVGLALTRIRNGLLGVIILGLLFADIAGWTVSGAANNFLHREQGLTLLLPSFLGVISLTGLAAVAGSLIKLAQEADRQRFCRFGGLSRPDAAFRCYPGEPFRPGTGITRYPGYSYCFGQ
jgi:hypothetical protein